MDFLISLPYRVFASVSVFKNLGTDIRNLSFENIKYILAYKFIHVKNYYQIIIYKRTI